jgi:hypothetical protein
MSRLKIQGMWGHTIRDYPDTEDTCAICNCKIEDTSNAHELPIKYAKLDPVYLDGTKIRVYVHKKCLLGLAYYNGKNHMIEVPLFLLATTSKEAT